jgi:glyoxylase-like metal-dependent hydrolase (beta-lactamase superfamily II)
MTSPSLVTVADRVHAWIGVSGDSNAGVIETPRGPIVIDAQQTASLGQVLRRAAEASAGKPVRCLIDTHFHLDHTAGNIAFADVPILAHERTRHRLRAILGPETSGPWRVTGQGEKLKLFFGDNFPDLVPDGDPAAAWFHTRVSGPEHGTIALQPPSDTLGDQFESSDVEALYWGPAHCDGDVVIHLPRARVAFLGDLLFVGRCPWFGDCDLDGWIACLDRILQLDLVTVIPGHGLPATLSDVAAFRDLLLATRCAVADAIDRGLSEEAALATIHLPRYATLPRYDAWMPFNLRATYRALSTRGRQS